MSDAEAAEILRELLGPPGYWHEDKRAAIERAIEVLETPLPNPDLLVDIFRRRLPSLYEYEYLDLAADVLAFLPYLREYNR